MRTEVGKGVHVNPQNVIHMASLIFSFMIKMLATAREVLLVFCAVPGTLCEFIIPTRKG